MVELVHLVERRDVLRERVSRVQDAVEQDGFWADGSDSIATNVAKSSKLLLLGEWGAASARDLGKAAKSVRAVQVNLRELIEGRDSLALQPREAVG